jgi:hypothetical protein
VLLRAYREPLTPIIEFGASGRRFTYMREHYQPEPPWRFRPRETGGHHELCLSEDSRPTTKLSSFRQEPQCFGQTAGSSVTCTRRARITVGTKAIATPFTGCHNAPDYTQARVGSAELTRGRYETEGRDAHEIGESARVAS